MLFSIDPNQKCRLIVLRRVLSSLFLYSFERIRVVASTLNQNLFLPPVASWLLHFPAPKSGFNSLRIAYIQHSFGFLLADTFLRTSSLLAIFYDLLSLIRVCFDPVVANIFSSFSLSLRTDLVLQHVIGWLSFHRLPLLIISFRIPFPFGMPGFSLLSKSETALILLLPAFSPLLPVPKNRFSPVKLPPDWNTFWPCFAAGFFLSFYPFRLPCIIFLICTKVASILLLPAFSLFLLSRETHTADNVPNWKRLSGFNFAANSLSFPYSVELPFHDLLSCIRVGFDSVVANFLSAFSLSLRTDTVRRIAISLVAFPNSPLQMFSFGFPCWEGSLVVVCYSVPELVLIQLLPTFPLHVPVPKDWFGIAISPLVR